MSKYRNGRLRILGNQGTALWDDNQLVASMFEARTNHKQARADAQRLVDCWNAAIGIEDPAAIRRNADRWTAKEKDKDSRIIQYAGAIGLLCQCSTNLREGAEGNDIRDSIEQAVADWCAITGWTWKRTFDRVEVFPPARAPQ